MRKLSIISAAFLAICFLVLSVSSNVQPSAAGPMTCAFPTEIAGTGYAINLTQSSQKSVFGQSVTFNASIVGGVWDHSYGSLIFVDGLQQIGEVALNTVNPKQVVSLSTSSLTAGDHTIAVYFVNECITNGGVSREIDSSIHGAWVDHMVLLALPKGPMVVSVK